jgi:hypothetical protein
VGVGVVQEGNVISASADGRRHPRLNSLHPLVVVDTLYPHSVICGFTISLYPHSVVCGFTESTFSRVDSLHPLYLYPLNPLYPHSVTPQSLHASLVSSHNSQLSHRCDKPRFTITTYAWYVNCYKPDDYKTLRCQPGMSQMVSFGCASIFAIWNKFHDCRELNNVLQQQLCF